MITEMDKNVICYCLVRNVKQFECLKWKRFSNSQKWNNGRWMQIGPYNTNLKNKIDKNFNAWKYALKISNICIYFIHNPLSLRFTCMTFIKQNGSHFI